MSSSQRPPQLEPRPTLATLDQVRLDARHEALLAKAGQRNGGPRHWRMRKLAEATELARLAQLSNRVLLLGLDLSCELRVELLLRVTVPRMPRPGAALEIADAAHLGLIYREEALVLPQPGYSFVQILGPPGVWHPNVSDGPPQVICLGARLLSGIPARELVLLTYFALAMVTRQMDPADAAGVLNPGAAEWWQNNVHRLPLSSAPFIDDQIP